MSNIPSGGGDETPEAEAARRRATLARLRAGGALGFGMFNHGPASPSLEDTRGLQDDVDAPPPLPSAPPSPPPVQGVEEEVDDIPPSTPSRPVAASGRTMPPTPTHEEEIIPPPVPSSRPTTIGADEGAPPTPSRPPQSPVYEVPPSTVRSTSTRPPIPEMGGSTRGSVPIIQERPATQSLAAFVPAQSSIASDWNISDEPAVMMMNSSQSYESSNAGSTRQPPPLPILTSPQAQPEPRRSMSTASHISTASIGGGQFSPASRQASRQNDVNDTAGRNSIQSGTGRPGFTELQAASKDSGARLLRAARGMFEKGRKGHYGVCPSLLYARWGHDTDECGWMIGW
jgi:hypothetical protein